PGFDHHRALRPTTGRAPAPPAPAGACRSQRGSRRSGRSPPERQLTTCPDITPRRVAVDRAGVGFGTSQALRMVGTSLGAALLGSLLTTPRAADSHSIGEQPPPACAATGSPLTPPVQPESARHDCTAETGSRRRAPC